MNARAALALRRSVGAGNPHHNITHHCITPRLNGGAPKDRRQMGKGISRPKVLPAAGYTTRRYVKLLCLLVEAPFSGCSARSSRRQEGVLLQGHPRPWPVAKPRTLRVPARKVPGTNTGSAARVLSLASSHCGTRVSCHLHALPLWTKRPRQGRALIVVAPVLGRSAAKDQAVGRAASLVFVVSTPRYGFAVFIYTCPLFLHTSAVVNHAGSVPGVQGAAVRNCSIASGCWRRECRAALSADCGRQD